MTENLERKLLKWRNETGLSLNDAVDKMRGPPNSQVHITVLRKGEKKPPPGTI